MKSEASQDNSYYSFTDKETQIEVIWEFNEKTFCWQILVFKDKEKEYTTIPASNKPTADLVNDYDIQRLSETTLRLVDFLAKRLKLDTKTSDK